MNERVYTDYYSMPLPICDSPGCDQRAAYLVEFYDHYKCEWYGKKVHGELQRCAAHLPEELFIYD